MACIEISGGVLVVDVESGDCVEGPRGQWLVPLARLESIDVRHDGARPGCHERDTVSTCDERTTRLRDDRDAGRSLVLEVEDGAPRRLVIELHGAAPRRRDDARRTSSVPAALPEHT